jgi:hypothetical protein
VVADEPGSVVVDPSAPGGARVDNHRTRLVGHHGTTRVVDVQPNLIDGHPTNPADHRRSNHIGPTYYVGSTNHVSPAHDGVLPACHHCRTDDVNGAARSVGAVVGQGGVGGELQLAG